MLASGCLVLLRFVMCVDFSQNQVMFQVIKLFKFSLPEDSFCCFFISGVLTKIQTELVKDQHYNSNFNRLL